LGLNRFIAQDFDDLQELVPTYMRPPDIRPNPFVPKSEKMDINESDDRGT
jgi:hypothetical protein